MNLTRIIARARAADIDLSALLTRALLRVVPAPKTDTEHGLFSDGLRMKAELEEQWLIDNRAAIEAYNRRVAEHGLLSDSAGLL